MSRLVIVFALGGCFTDHTVSVTVQDLANAELDVFYLPNQAPADRTLAGITFPPYGDKKCPVLDMSVVASANDVPLIVYPGSADHDGAACASPELGGFPDASSASMMQIVVTDGKLTATMTYVTPASSILDCTGFETCAFAQP
jgi:hypothetical protein